MVPLTVPYALRGCGRIGVIRAQFLHASWQVPGAPKGALVEFPPGNLPVFPGSFVGLL